LFERTGRTISKEVRDECQDDTFFTRMHCPSDWSDAERQQVKEVLSRFSFTSLADGYRLKYDYSDYGETWQITLQVLSLLWLEAGLPLTTIEQEVIVTACESDTWAKEDYSRERVLQEHIQRVRQHGVSDRPVSMLQDGDVVSGTSSGDRE